MGRGATPRRHTRSRSPAQSRAGRMAGGISSNVAERVDLLAAPGSRSHPFFRPSCEKKGSRGSGRRTLTMWKSWQIRRVSPDENPRHGNRAAHRHTLHDRNRRRRSGRSIEPMCQSWGIPMMDNIMGLPHVVHVARDARSEVGAPARQTGVPSQHRCHPIRSSQRLSRRYSRRVTSRAARRQMMTRSRCFAPGDVAHGETRGRGTGLARPGG
jgi:hypothetical protein